MPNPLENNLLLYFLAGAGKSIGGPGSFGADVGGMAQMNIAAQSQAKTQGKYSQLLRDMLAGGGKLNMDKDNVSIKAPTAVFSAGGGSAGPGGGVDVRSGLEGSIPQPQPTGPGGGVDSRVTNPSSSPLDIDATDLAGLTPENVSGALRNAIGVGDLERRTVSDVIDSIYKGALTGRVQAATKQLTPSITVPGHDIKLTETGFLNWYRTASRDQRSSKIKEYEYARDQGYEGSFESWAKEMSKAAGMGLAEYLERRSEGTRVSEVAKQSTKILGPNFANDVRKDLMKDKMNWAFPDSYDYWIGEGFDATEATRRGQLEMQIESMDARLREFYTNKGKTVVRKNDGWYVGDKLIKEYPK